MDTTAELNTEESLSSDAAMAADNAPPESTGAEVGQAPAPSVSEPDASHEPEAKAQGGEAVPAEPASPKLDLISFFPASERAPRIEAAPPKAPRNFVAPGLVALALLFLLGAGAVYQQMHRSALLAVKVRQNEHLVSTVSNLTERLDAIEGARAREETADVRKLLGEMKLGASATRDVSAAVSQLTARVDHVERDQGARLDKLAERIDHDASSRFADSRSSARQIGKEGRLADCRRGRPGPRRVAALCGSRSSARQIGKEGRLADCRRGRSGPRRVAALCGSRSSARQIGKEGRLADCRRGRPGPAAQTDPDSGESRPGVSNETTASIEKPKPPLRGYAVIGVGDGFATIRGREGEISVGAGDIIPGLGRVLRIERHGREWLVVTSVGVISGEGGPY